VRSGGGHVGSQARGLIGGKRGRREEGRRESYPPPWADIHRRSGELGREDGADLPYLAHEVGVGSEGPVYLSEAVDDGGMIAAA
jgi:hypothetical protein